MLAPPRRVPSDVESIVCVRRSRCAADRLHAIEQAPAPSTNLSYVDAQKAFFKKRRKEAQAARDGETAAAAVAALIAREVAKHKEKQT